MEIFEKNEGGNFMVNRRKSAIKQKYINLAEVSAFLGISKYSVRMMMEKGQIPFYSPVSSHIFFDKKEIEKWVRGNGGGGKVERLKRKAKRKEPKIKLIGVAKLARDIEKGEGVVPNINKDDLILFLSKLADIDIRQFKIINMLYGIEGEKRSVKDVAVLYRLSVHSIYAIKGQSLRNLREIAVEFQMSGIHITDHLPGVKTIIRKPGEENHDGRGSDQSGN